MTTAYYKKAPGRLLVKDQHTGTCRVNGSPDRVAALNSGRPRC